MAFGIGILAVFAVIEAGWAQAPVSVDTLAAPHAGEFVVPINKSQILRVDTPYKDLLVGNPEIADVLALTDRSIYVLGKTIGSTSLTIYGSKKELLAIVDLVVSYDVAGLKAKLHEILPGERIEVRPSESAIIVGGMVSSAENLAQVLSVANHYAPGHVTNLLKVEGSQQVMLEVRFAEVQRSVAKDIGVSNVLSYASNDFFFFADTFASVTNTTGAVGPLPLTLTGTSDFADFAAAGTTGRWTIGAIFDFLETKGVVKTLAEPNLVVLSGDTASFLAGGEFPICVQQAGAAAGAITVEFKEFGVGLAFTPTVLGDGLINLSVAPEVSALDPDPTRTVTTECGPISSLVTRRANTTVELRDGQSLAIAGLITDDFNDTIIQYPWLGDIPVLGALFRSTEFEKRETELVVVVTPRLVKPVMAGAIMAPTDTFVPPTEKDLFLYGRLEDPSSGRAPAAVLGAGTGGGITGSYGHIIK
jgi:pilus assembly protein CpaC